MARLLLMNVLWIDEEDEQRAHAAVIDALRPFKVEGTSGRVATFKDTETDRDLYDTFMAETDELSKETSD